MWYMYTMEYYSAIRNDDMCLESKWMQLEDIMLSEVSKPGSERQRLHVFFHIWKIEPMIN
jgi:hypothetical protein